MTTLMNDVPDLIFGLPGWLVLTFTILCVCVLVVAVCVGLGFAFAWVFDNGLDIIGEWLTDIWRTVSGANRRERRRKEAEASLARTARPWLDAGERVQPAPKIFPVLRVDALLFWAQDFTYDPDTAFYLTVHHGNRTASWLDYFAPMRKWIDRVPLTDAEHDRVVDMLRYWHVTSTPTPDPTPRDRAAMARLIWLGQNTYTEQQLLDLVKGHEHLKNEHARVSNLLRTVESANGTLQTQRDAAERKLRNTQHDLDLVVAKGRRRKAAARRLHELYGEVRAVNDTLIRRRDDLLHTIDSQRTVIRGCEVRIGQLLGERADLDAIIDRYHETGDGRCDALQVASVHDLHDGDTYAAVRCIERGPHQSHKADAPDWFARAYGGVRYILWA